jgi:hypothetical protein
VLGRLTAETSGSNGGKCGERQNCCTGASVMRRQELPEGKRNDSAAPAAGVSSRIPSPMTARAADDFPCSFEATPQTASESAAWPYRREFATSQPVAIAAQRDCGMNAPPNSCSRHRRFHDGPASRSHDCLWSGLPSSCVGGLSVSNVVAKAHINCRRPRYGAAGMIAWPRPLLTWRGRALPRTLPRDGRADAVRA